VDWLDVTVDEAAVRAVLMRTAHSRLPVGAGSTEALLGVVQSRELLAALLAGQPLDLRAAARRAPVVPDTADALDVLATLRAAWVPTALVHDEYGHFEES
jgi:putative hemolysin